MKELKKLQSIFQTISDYSRLNILSIISDKECAVGEIVRSAGLSQPLVSHHLKVLKENGFLKTNRKGPFIYYSLKDQKILVAMDLFLEIFKDSDLSEVNTGFRFCPDSMMGRFKFFNK